MQEWIAHHRAIGVGTCVAVIPDITASLQYVCLAIVTCEFQTCSLNAIKCFAPLQHHLRALLRCRKVLCV